jgi:hypothetical protein
MSKEKYEVHDLVRYFHNVRNKKGELNPIIGEDKLAVTSALAYLLEDNNMVIKAYSGTGKTVIMDAVFGLLPAEYYHTIEHLSETAVWYESDRINRARFVAIPEAQKLPEGVMEVIKTWGDNRAAFRKRTDVTIGETVEQVLNPKYVFMCVAVENAKGSAYFDAELERRCMIGHTNPTAKQTASVIKHKLMYAALPRRELLSMTDEEIRGLKQHVLDAIGRRDDERAVQLRNPCAPFLMNAIPAVFPVSRSKVQYLLKVVNAVARFHEDEILHIERDGVKYGLVTPKHNWLALRIYLDTFISECLHMPSHGTDILQLFPDTALDSFGMSADVVKLTVSEIKKEAKRAGLPFTKLTPVLSALVMTGFLEMDETERGKTRYYKSPLISDPSKKIKWGELIGETERFVREKWPKIAKEYIERYCGSIEIVDPFSGDNIKLGKGAKTAIDVELADKDVKAPFKSKSDELLWDGDMTKFLLLATGDYDSKEIKQIEKMK